MTDPRNTAYAFGAALVLSVGASIMPASAEPPTMEEPLKVAGTEATPRTPPEVLTIIQELASVRDYERLRWILDAIEEQVPPARAELLQQLDDQVQRLVEAEVQARATSAAEALQLLSTTPSVAASQPPAAHDAAAQPVVADDAGWSERPPSVPTYSYEEAKQKLDLAQFSSDQDEAGKQMTELFRTIEGVESADQRKELLDALHQRRQQAFREQARAAVEAAAASGDNEEPGRH